MTLDEFKKNISPLIRHGWIAMDKCDIVRWRWYIQKPYPDLKRGVWKTPNNCCSYSMNHFIMPNVKNWMDSLIEVGDKS